VVWGLRCSPPSAEGNVVRYFPAKGVRRAGIIADTEPGFCVGKKNGWLAQREHQKSVKRQRLEKAEDAPLALLPDSESLGGPRGHQAVFALSASGVRAPAQALRPTLDEGGLRLLQAKVPDSPGQYE